ncbi:uncharacterized protein LOC135202802 [Macrobrachium nipponense]|uniref:uncharacterized protein LOC135202802 n=1 Tax=Macrobrachium nipponense TaxID=159736 RepID=UPI0030C7B793
MFDQYHSVLDEYVKLGFIEEVKLEDNSFDPVGGINHYLPHHPVFKESATTPFRIVFNASSKESHHAKSLNDCLNVGPNLATKLTDMLLKFRQNKYVVVADISKAFLRIGMNENHRDFTRFLWFADRDFKHVKNFRFKVLLFGATCSPFLLNQTIQYHLQNHSDPIASSVKKSFYVENFMKTYEKCEDLELESNKVNQIMLEANMPLGEWASNLSSFNDKHSPDTVNLNAVKLLGLLWDTCNDSLSVEMPSQIVTYLNNLGNVCTLTKRKVVSLLSTIFDPLGILTPVTIKGKLFVKKLWGLKTDWDDELMMDLKKEFDELLNQLSSIEEIKVPRSCFNEGTCSLHVFVDASHVAYGACAYVVSSKHTSHLLINCTVWSDSQVALSWVFYERSKEVFVINRVKEIKDLKSSHNIRLLYVKSEDNPADLVTRGISMSLLSKSGLWFHGPNWIIDKNKFPEQEDVVYIESVNVNEIIVEPVLKNPDDVLVFKCSEFSSLKHALRINTASWFLHVNVHFRVAGITDEGAKANIITTLPEEVFTHITPLLDTHRSDSVQGPEE